MILLPHGCSCSSPSVFPSNWKTVGASIAKEWRIQYYFREPDKPKPKLIIVKGMNHFKDVKDRREMTLALLNNELEELRSGYNPIEKVTRRPDNTVFEVEYYTPFAKAMKIALTKLKVGPQQMLNIRCALVYILKAVDYLGYSNIEVGSVKRRHILAVLEACPKIKPYWSPQLHNHYRSFIMRLFTALIQMQAVENNPVDRYLPLESIEENLRELLTDEERIRIERHFAGDKYFHRFLHIFFHSGARPVELLRLKVEAIDIEGMFYKIKVRKRKNIIEEKRPIKNIVRHLWQEILNEGAPEDFIFGRNLIPGPIPCPRDYLTKKWQREVKGVKDGKPFPGLNINKDLYSLKHLNLDETSAILDAEAAAKQAGHQSTAITLKHYLINEDERQRKRLSGVNNKFA